MRIFISYASEQRRIADRIALGLRDQGHEVFFDRDDLPPGDGYNQRIQQEIGRADLLVFLISPQSISPHRYTLTELKLARQRWRSPKNRVLPVMIEPTPFDQLPAFLSTVSVLEPTGDSTAEVLSTVDLMVRRLRAPRKRILAAVAGLAIAVVVTIVVLGVFEPKPPIVVDPTPCYLTGEVRRPDGAGPGWLLYATAEGMTDSFTLNDEGHGPLQVTLKDDTVWHLEVIDPNGAAMGQVELTGCPETVREFRLDGEVGLLVHPREVQ